MRKQVLPIVGHSKGRPIYDIFQFCDTYGMPLDVMMEILDEVGAGFSVPHFIAGAQASKWSDKTILGTLRNSFVDRNGQDAWDYIEPIVLAILSA